jgi:hypothetical protein
LLSQERNSSGAHANIRDFLKKQIKLNTPSTPNANTAVGTKRSNLTNKK